MPALHGVGIMLVEQMHAAIAAAPRGRLVDLSKAVWNAYAGGAIGEDDAQALAEAVEARKAISAPIPARRLVGSRPRSPESMERRRRWVAAGLMPPPIASRFTMGESAVLAVIAAEVSKRGHCMLTIGHIAAVAGVCKTTVRNAVRQAAALGLLRSEECRLAAFRSAPNTVTILSAEWLAWLRLGSPNGRVVRARSDHGGADQRTECLSRREGHRLDKARAGPPEQPADALGRDRRELRTPGEHHHADGRSLPMARPLCGDGTGGN